VNPFVLSLSKHGAQFLSSLLALAAKADLPGAAI
jgi:hypothetical protein